MKAAGESVNTNTGKLVPAYELEWVYPVWQLRFDEKAGLIAVECREADTLQTAFSVFRAKTGELLLRDYKPAKAWWQNLAANHNGILYLQGVSAKGVGRSVGITAVSINDAQVKWQQPEFSFHSLTGNTILALSAAGESTELICLNPETGEEMGQAGSMAACPEKAASLSAEESRAIMVPQHYPAENKYFTDLKLFVQNKTGFDALYAIDYLEHKNMLALGFYRPQENKLQTYQLAVFSLTGELCLQVDLGKDLSGIGTDNFFIFQDTLILVKNKKTLLGYEV
ncbi:hypothetical protein AAE02nite_17900 [Adhaeribacter aerolatus]|uniref:DUF4905 domain-containing protein n=1 Tax=Adhaeribacter aerolatus TaxID=670289 RepID=A0A512AWM9_9BACT|nr:DUF4905 domain-containing protein [Adhaeribacter aerolatus]GEO04126.1 hypothetical protein AAE02nite_17900 [Adhaeribacter aerolatus]